MAFLNRLILLFSVIFLFSACQNPASQSSNVSSNDEQKITHLLTLIDQRLNIAPQVAKAKWNSGSPVNDTKREAKVLYEVTAQAKLIGKEKCEPALVKKFFQDQFTAGKIIQTHLLISWRNKYPAKHKFKDAPNLARDIRPQLDKLTPELITAFCDVEAVLQAGSRKYLFVQADKVIRGDVDGAARRQALKVFKVE
jgi:chorismate mutase